MARTRWRLRLVAPPAPQAPSDITLDIFPHDEGAVSGTIVGAGTVIDADSASMQSVTIDNAKYEITNLTGKSFYVRISAAGQGDFDADADEDIALSATDPDGLSVENVPFTIPVTAAGEETLIEEQEFIATANDVANVRHLMISAEFAPGEIAADQVAFVKVNATEVPSYMGQIATKAAAGTDLMSCCIYIRVPAETFEVGSNTIEIFVRDGARDFTNKRTLQNIIDEDIYTVHTNVRDGADVTEGSGEFKAEIAAWIEEGAVNLTILDANPLCTVYEITCPWLDTTGGAQHPTMTTTFHVYAWNDPADDSLAVCEIDLWMHNGAHDATGEADGRYYDTDLYLGGVAQYGVSTGQAWMAEHWHFYYSLTHFAKPNGRSFWTESDYEIEGYQKIDVEMRKAKGFLPNLRTTKLLSSDRIVPEIAQAPATSVLTSTSSQGAISVNPSSVPFLRPSDYSKGQYAARIKGDSMPTNAVADTPYFMTNAPTNTHAFPYPTQKDACNDTNKVIPNEGGISAGSNLRIMLAYAPGSSGMISKGWAAPGERQEIGLISELANQHVLDQNEYTMDQLRVNALCMGRQQMFVTKGSTHRILECRTNSATYPGLGTGNRSATINNNFWTGMQAPAARGSAGNPYGRTDGETIREQGAAHTPSCDYFWIWAWEPKWRWHRMASFWAAGMMLLHNARQRTYNSQTIYTCCYAQGSANARADAWQMRTALLATTRLPDAVVSGTWGEKQYFLDIEADNAGFFQHYLTAMTAATPVAAANGMFLNTFDMMNNDTDTAPGEPGNWQWGHRGSVIGMGANRLFHADWSDFMEFFTLTARAIGGSPVTGSFAPILITNYYWKITHNAPPPLEISGGWSEVGLNGGTPTLDADADTISFSIGAQPVGFSEKISDGDPIRFLRHRDTVSSVPNCGNLSFSTTYYAKNVSRVGLIITCQLEEEIDGGVVDITDETVSHTRVWFRPAVAPAFGCFWTDQVYALQTSALVYAIYNANPTFPTELAAVAGVLANIGGEGVEPTWTTRKAKYAWKAAA